MTAAPSGKGSLVTSLASKRFFYVFVVLRAAVIDCKQNDVCDPVIMINELFLSDRLKLSISVIFELVPPLPPMTKREGGRTMVKDNMHVETHLDHRQVEVPVVKFSIQALGMQP